MQEDASEASERSPLWSLVLSLLVPGLGHWYLGRVRAAVAFVIALAAGLPLCILLGTALPIDAGYVIYAVVAGAWAVRIAAALHAAWVARATDFVPTRAHSAFGYAAFVVIAGGLGYLASTATRTLIMEPFKSPSQSGLPNLDAGDHFAITKLTARDRAGLRGDLVVFPMPGNPEELFVKRVVGLPGETIEFDGGILVIDGVKVDATPCAEPPPSPLPPGAITCLVEHTPEGVRYPIVLPERIGAESGDPPPEPQRKSFAVPDGHVFAVGDNRLQSHDSTAFGPVPQRDIAGRAAAVWFPVNRAHSLIPKGAR